MERLAAPDVAEGARFAPSDDESSCEPLNWVSVEPFRKRFLALEAAGELSRRQLAIRLGWYRSTSPCMRRAGDCAPDTGRVGRTLGLKGDMAKNRVKYEVGAVLCRALGMDPIDAGV